MFIMFTAFLCYICNLFVTIHIPLLVSLRNTNLKLETCRYNNCDPLSDEMHNVRR